MHLARFVDTREQRHLGIGRAAMDERAAGVVADTAKHRGADAGRPDHGVRIAPQWSERVFELVERGAGQADHLVLAAAQTRA